MVSIRTSSEHFEILVGIQKHGVDLFHHVGESFVFLYKLLLSNHESQEIYTYFSPNGLHGFGTKAPNILAKHASTRGIRDLRKDQWNCCLYIAYNGTNYKPINKLNYSIAKFKDYTW